VAGVQLLYNSDLVGAALGFVNELQHHKSRVLERTADAGDEPGRPQNLTERVLHSFARHDIPVDRPVSLPLISVDMYCPGTQIVPMQASHLGYNVLSINATAFADQSCFVTCEVSDVCVTA